MRFGERPVMASHFNPAYAFIAALAAYLCRAFPEVSLTLDGLHAIVSAKLADNCKGLLVAPLPPCHLAADNIHNCPSDSRKSRLLGSFAHRFHAAVSWNQPSVNERFNTSSGITQTGLNSLSCTAYSRMIFAPSTSPALSTRVSI